MEYIDAATIANQDFNGVIKESIAKGAKEIEVSNVHAMHNICAGLDKEVEVTIKDSTGLYTCSYLENAKVTVEGNVGWYAGDNMVSGELIVKKNTGCNVGAYIYGGNLVIYGNAGSRIGYGMRGGNILVAGSVGRWAGQMAMGGNLIVLGNVGPVLGESMFEGKIFTRDAKAEQKLGGNVTYSDISEEEIRELNQLFEKYGLDARGNEFHVVRPILNKSGKHTYVLFKPDLKPELANKYRGGKLDGENS